MSDKIAGRRRRFKRIKNTPSGQRAIKGAQTGTDFVTNEDGSKSSIRTATFGVIIDGEERTVIAPTIVKEGGRMVRLSDKQAIARAMATGDAAVVKSQAVGDRRSRKFSRRLGNISRRRNK